ncbi:MF14A-like protein, partial [Mya arenaria]
GSGKSHPSIYHALVVIFLEFFAWGLLTAPMIDVLNETFPNHTFLLNGLIQGVKVSATFAASLVTSPAIGAYLGNLYSDNVVVWLATSIALLDVLFIVVFVPESLPEKVRPTSWGAPISWEKVDPFSSLRKMSHDYLILLLCITVFLSYLPEAGEYSCFFIMLFSEEETVILALLMKYLGHKESIVFGLLFEAIQLACYGFGSQD